MIKKFIAIFLLSLMLLQVLPLASIGSMLCKDQWTEEIPHGNCSHLENVDMSKFNCVLPYTQKQYCDRFTSMVAIVEQLLNNNIPSNHAKDVVCPPPDVLV